MQDIDFVLKYLLKESGRENFNYEERDKKRLYRALVNVREPKEVSKEFLDHENKFLKGELKKEKIINVSEINTVKEEFIDVRVKNADKIAIIKGDLSLIKCDAVVNPGNSRGLGCFRALHSCLDNQLHTKAGISLRLECNEYMKAIDYNLETSKCFMTNGFNLPSKFVIHTVGPIVSGYLTEELKIKLRDTYINCLKCAVKNNIRTVAFPCISTGVFRFPKDEASRIAVDSVDNFISGNREKIDKVIFCLWDNEDVKYYEQNIK